MTVHTWRPPGQLHELTIRNRFVKRVRHLWFVRLMEKAWRKRIGAVFSRSGIYRRRVPDSCGTMQKDAKEEGNARSGGLGASPPLANVPPLFPRNRERAALICPVQPLCSFSFRQGRTLAGFAETCRMQIFVKTRKYNGRSMDGRHPSPAPRSPLLVFSAARC